MKKNLCTTLLLCFTLLSLSLHAQRKTYDVKESKFSKADFEKLKSVLKGADPSTYSVQYVMNGKTVDKLGSASFDRLSTVAVYHSPGSRSDINEVLTTISNYVKTILTSKFNQAYPEKVTAINSILEASAVTGKAATMKVDIREANVTKADFEKLKASLSGADPSTYSLIYTVNGRQVDKAGSASFRSLTTVGAFHKPGSSSDINEVVTTISNYVKTILTSKFNQAYPEKLAQFNRELEGISQ
jgi:hypothetical protein